MDTPITISSGLTSIGIHRKKASKTHSEPSIARVPVNWDSPRKSCDRELNCTPSTLQKVNSWINSLSKLDREHVGSNPSSHRQGSDISDYDNSGGDLVMSDDNMNSELKGQIADDELDNCCKSSDEYEDNTKEYESTSNTCKKTRFGGGLKKHFHPNSSKRHKLLQSYTSVEQELDKFDEYDSDVPLSPESEKKKELCSYLKLMKPSDKKTVMILQNRRSVRVKNLSLMQEKKELEKKLKEGKIDENSQNGHCDTDVEELMHPELRSFSEMNINPDKKKYKWLSYGGTKSSSSDTFVFPKPAVTLKKTVVDFDDVKVNWLEDKKEEFNRKQTVESSKQLVKINENKKKAVDIVTSNTNKHKMKGEAIKKQRKFLIQSKTVKTRKEDTSSSVPENKEKLEITSYNHNHKKNSIQTNKKENGNKRRLSNSSNDPRYQNTSKPEFSIPKPFTNFAKDVNDFDYVLMRKSVELKTNGLSSLSNQLENTYQTENKTIKSSKAISIPFLSNKLENKSNETKKSVLDIAKLTLPSASSKSEDKSKERKKSVLDTPKIKVSLLKKKNKVKKLKLNRSSFKIKLKLRSKSDKKLMGKSKLITKTMKSLRDRSSDKYLSKEVKSKVSKKKQKSLNKKENKTHKKEECNGLQIRTKKFKVDPASKTPFKDTNENPSENLIESIVDVVKSPVKTNIPEISQNDAKAAPVSKKASPKTGDDSNRVSNVQHLLDIDFNNLSHEHKTSLFLSNIVQNEREMPEPIIAIYHKDNTSCTLGSPNSKSSFSKTRDKGEYYSQILNIEKPPEEDYIPETVKPSVENVPKEYLTPTSSKEKLHTHLDSIHKTPAVTLFSRDATVSKSLHKCLNNLTPRSAVSGNLEVENSPTSWPPESPTHKPKKSQYSINICKDHGMVLKAFYLEYNLVLCQEFMVSFWTQTALGNILGAQNMWIHKGSVQRMAMNNNCIFKESLEMVVSTDSNVAYIELWTKEHQSNIRQGPVADVFATVYFWKKGQNGLDKKVLQLENINGFADDVQYSVFKSTPKVIVSWHLACSEPENKKTFIHCYQLSGDYQTVYNIKEFEAVEHYVSSLHNIDGCDSLIMGCGENKITLWNIDDGYVMATIEMSEIKSPLATLWVKCDRGFLFTLQQCVDRELRLIAIHGMNHSWKKLASYDPPDEYDRLKGVCVENGLVLAFYDQGVICWNAQTAETIVEDTNNEAEYISGKYVINIVNDQVNIRHVITHLLSVEDL